MDISSGNAIINRFQSNQPRNFNSQELHHQMVCQQTNNDQDESIEEYDQSMNQNDFHDQMKMIY